MSTKFATPPLAEALPAGAFEVVPTRDEIPTIVVPAGELVNVCRILRDHPSLRFNVCLDVTCADVFPRQPRFHVVYHLVSTDIPLTMRVRVILGEGRKSRRSRPCGRRRTGRNAKCGTCSAWFSQGIRSLNGC